MAWTRHGNRRRRDDRRALLTHVAPVHPGDRLAEPPAADPWQVLTREIDRCRRYGHPLALVRVVAGRPSDPTPPPGPTPPGGRATRGRPGPPRPPAPAAACA